MAMISMIRLAISAGILANSGAAGAQTVPLAQDQAPLGEPVYGPERHYEGEWITAFEVSNFAGCWFIFTNDAWRTMESVVPDPTELLNGARFQLEFVGRQTLPDPRRSEPMSGYGHMNMAPCQIQATRIISARRLPLDD